MTLPTNFYLVHDSSFHQTVEVFEDEADAVAHAEEMASYEGCPWYVAACLVPNAVAYTAGKRKAKTKARKRTPQAPKGDTER